MSLGFSAQDYASLFAPLSISAIIAYMFSDRLRSRVGTRTALISGVVVGAVAMFFLWGSSRIKDGDILRDILNLVFVLTGVSLALNMRNLNLYLSRYFPWKTSGAPLMISIMTGLGSLVVSVMLATTFSMNYWGYVPLIVFLLAAAVALAIYYYMGDELPVELLLEEDLPKKKGEISLWFYAGILTLYGFCETLFGNWSAVYLTASKGFTAGHALWALSLFWGAVVFGRICSLALETRVGYERVYRLSSWLLIFALFFVVLGSGDYLWAAIFMAGTGCSVFFLLTQKYAEKALSFNATLIADIMMGAYVIGYAFAAYGVGLAEPSGKALGSTFIVGAIAALCSQIMILRRYR